MQKIVFCLFIGMLASLSVTAQFEQPSDLAQRLGNDKSFSRYAREMMRYVRDRQASEAQGSRERAYYEKQEKFLARQLWFLEGRQAANGDITDYTRRTFAAFTQYEATRAANRVAASAYGSWSVVGPTNMSVSTASKSTGIGRVDRIAFHPSDPDIIFAGTPAGGIFKTTNGGSSWFNLNSFMPSLGVSGLVVSWADANDIYVLTGDGDSNIGDNGFVQGFDYIRPSIGVLKSTDGGATWQQTASLGLTGFYVGYKLVQSPTNANVLIAATSQGLFRTTNGGASWDLVSPNSNRYYDLEWKPGSSTRVYACTAGTFYLSTDGGASFVNSNANFDFSISSGDRTAIAVTPANANYVFVFTTDDLGSSGDNIGIFRSTDSGDSFIRRTTSNTMVAGSPAYMHNLAVASDNVNIVLTGELDIWRSTDGGANFSQSNQRSDATQADYAHDDIHELAYNPLDDALYVGSDGGVYKSTDDGISYTALYAGMNATQYYHFDVSTSNDDYMLGGAQDNGGHLRNANTTTFLNTIKGDGYDTRFYNNAAAPAYISVNQRLFKSNAVFTSYTQMTGIPDDWYKTIAMVYSNSDIVFTSSNPVYRTVDGGANWTNQGANGRWAMITCPSNSNRVYAAGGDSWNDGGANSNKRIYRSDDQGDTWSQLQGNPGFPTTITKITGIAVDPGNSLRVWVTMGGFTDGEKVYYSSNGGDTWVNLSGTLPNIPINCVTVDANLDAYIGTDVGVFYKGAAMSDWQPFYNHMPRVPVTELHIRGTTIYASTFGRGIWRSDTHGDCPAGLGLAGNISGVKFYEAETITTSTTLVGGVGTEIFLKASNYVNLSVGFRANAATGEKFRAWIANCSSGGIPAFRPGDAEAIAQRLGTNDRLQMSSQDSTRLLRIQMPFDAKANLVLLDEQDKLKEVWLHDKMLNKGLTQVRTSAAFMPGKEKLVLMIDGEPAAVILK